MGLILLEALLALVILLLIVWWTMFHGNDTEDDPPQEAGAQTPSPQPQGEDGNVQTNVAKTRD